MLIKIDMKNVLGWAQLRCIPLYIIIIGGCSQKEQNLDPPPSAAIVPDTVLFSPDTALAALSAHLFYETDEYDQASREYGRLIQMDRQNGKFLYRKGYCLVKLDSPLAALAFFERAAQLKFMEAECYYNIGGIYASIGMDSSATAFFQKALRLEPDMEKAKSFLSDVSARKPTVSL